MIEVWLTQKNIAVRCMVVREDERTAVCSVRSASMRGAQREVTSRLAVEGYEAVSRWRREVPDGRETSRRFHETEAHA